MLYLGFARFKPEFAVDLHGSYLNVKIVEFFSVKWVSESLIYRATVRQK